MAKVFLNIYDLNPNNKSLRPIGLGMYHSGVAVHGVEYTFGQEGLGTHTPKNVTGAVFRESIELGETNMNEEQISYLARELGKEGFKGSDYHFTKNNCNHYARGKHLHILNLKLQHCVYCYSRRTKQIDSPNG
jgi:hypothetical protein